MNAKHPSLSYDVYIAATPDKVWKAITDSHLTKQYYYGCSIKGDFKKGAVLHYVAGDMEMMRTEVKEIVNGKRLLTTCEALWDESVSKDKPSLLIWELTAMGPSTRLTLLHDGFASSTATYEQCASGWPVILSSMKTLLETGKPLVVGN
jgi:uncharacterized protein YndB with AHSA1/START domain